jgi:hypothetical protein
MNHVMCTVTFRKKTTLNEHSMRTGTYPMLDVLKLSLMRQKHGRKKVPIEGPGVPIGGPGVPIEGFVIQVGRIQCL